MILWFVGFDVVVYGYRIDIQYAIDKKKTNKKMLYVNRISIN